MLCKHPAQRWTVTGLLVSIGSFLSPCLRLAFALSLAGVYLDKHRAFHALETQPTLCRRLQRTFSVCYLLLTFILPTIVRKAFEMAYGENTCSHGCMKIREEP